MISVQEIRERVERDEYEVDADRVAEAILARLLASARTPASDRRPPER